MFFRSLYKRTDRTIYLLEKIVMTQAELTVKLDGLIATVKKIGVETAKTLQMVVDLKASAGEADPALVAKLEELEVQAKATDDLIADE